MPPSPRFSCLLRLPRSARLHFFAGLYFRPDEPFPPLTVSAFLDATPLGSYLASTGADHDLEFELPPTGDRPCAAAATVTLLVNPPCPPDVGPALRCLGFYSLALAP